MPPQPAPPPSEDAYSNGPEPQSEAPDDAREDRDNRNTGVLPKALFPSGVKPGTRYELEVDRVFDEEVSCRIIPKSESEPDKADAEEPSENEAESSAPQSDPMYQ